MLMLMKSQTEAMRALAYVVAAARPRFRAIKTRRRKRHQAFVDLMIPVVKGWSTETGIEVASLGVQVHGGMGFIEETGAAQHLRDARITTIYEGTTGIQAMDLVGRKIAREGGATAKAWLEVKKLDAQLRRRKALADGVRRSRVRRLHRRTKTRVQFAGAVPFLKEASSPAAGDGAQRCADCVQRRMIHRLRGKDRHRPYAATSSSQRRRFATRSSIARPVIAGHRGGAAVRLPVPRRRPPSDGRA